MFFWNKFCGLAFFIFSNSTALPAQNRNVPQLIKNRFILKNILLNPEMNEPSDWNDLFFEKKDDLLSSKSSGESYVVSVGYLKKNYYPSLPVSQQPAQLKPSQLLLPDLIPANLSTCQYGFFCKQELKIEKATKLPIRVRLGSLQQCNYYEGKP